jgi:hypothetical protein
MSDRGLAEFMWRSAGPWPELIAAATAVIERWNTVTKFVVNTDMRERVWTVRHTSTHTPFLVISQDSMRGSVPRIGNPMPLLLLIGIGIAQPKLIELSFANGQKIDPARFDPADLTALLPHATHPAHRKLAELAVQPGAIPPAQSAAAG